MSRRTLFACLLFFSGIFLAAGPTEAAGKKKSGDKPGPGLSTVEKVLRAEVAGQVDRRGQLAATLATQPDSAAARWQAGFVRDGDSWRSFDESPPTTARSELLKRYRSRRDEAPQTFPGQLDLANWCRKQGVKDLEQVHLLRALSLVPDQEQPALLERLGYTQVGTQWVSNEQLRDWQRAIRQAEESLKKWSSKLERMAQRLTGNKAQREAALADLRAIADPSAVPAIELVLAGRDAETARAVVETLNHIEGPAASLALAKQGVFSSWLEVRKSASQALHGRKFEDFVPALISLLATPAQGEYRMLYDPSRGVLLYSYIMATEMENQFQVAALNVVSQVVFVRTGTTTGPIRIDDDIARSPSLQLTKVDSLRIGSDALYPRERQRETVNDRIEELNSRVIGVLAEISGAELGADTRKWWQWWYDYTDAPPAGAKATVVVSETEAVAPTVIPFLTSSCFAAGTSVWSETGPVSIETIKAGDRVLAKDIESGELTYKPVLLTTVNPPKDLMAVRFDEESIVCTKGHRFWNSGGGWIKARDLAPQTLLHTVTGNTPVWSAKSAPAQKTYNLVVDDFHTYFVGKTGVLCQDLRSSNGSDCVVPGLHRSRAVAQAAK